MPNMKSKTLEEAAKKAGDKAVQQVMEEMRSKAAKGSPLPLSETAIPTPSKKTKIFRAGKIG